LCIKVPKRERTSINSALQFVGSPDRQNVHRPSPPKDLELLKLEKEQQKAREKYEHEQAVQFLVGEDRQLHDFYHVQNDVLGKGTFGMVWRASRKNSSLKCAV
tara:strand:- start:745 stop:1053 length:309 start_codon:yes stop_codon:yes gene_type:complete